MTHIIASDVHLGSSVCRAEEFILFLASIPKEAELILNGDLFDSWDFRRLEETHWRVLSAIRRISEKNKVSWIIGNHDGPADPISHLIGVDFMEEYAFVSGGKKFLVLHGDVFDDFIAKHPVATRMADCAYRLIQKIKPGFALFAKNRSKTFLRCSERVKDRAKSYARSKGAAVVCCGHTHLAEQDLSGSVEYHNSGCWTEPSCHYLFVREGSTSLIEFSPASWS